ncbi:alkyl/aryl-sulfatase [Nocardioides sp. NPDC057577]|uniref:alkyl/aryl-sulfatase n=1 Tax=Nocardioides sp. NPDC057577 TaxID=3346171 RepID=UPI00366AB3D4
MADFAQEEADAHRGFIASLKPGVVAKADGSVAFDADADAFLDAPAPPTAHAGLWQHSRLTSLQGLFEVTDGIYQVRGLDLANLTIVEGHRGIIVIDTLTTAETAAAALGLYRAHRGDRPVTGVVLTHPHADHFGGIAAVLAAGAGDVPVLAPEGFLEHAVSENVYVGPAMGRRSGFMYGSLLPVTPDGHVGCGLGPRLASGSIALAAPTDSVTRTGETRVIDGVEMELQLTPGSEAPAEMNILLPRHRALCLAENAVHTLHNIVTLRGAEVRDARLWARYLTEALSLFTGRVDVAFATHHWPTWGAERIEAFLSGQRDVYAYLHDQTVRLINRGLTPKEIAEELVLPPALDAQPSTRGYYGSLSHNVKGIYQRYLGWYDANPAHLWDLPPKAEGERWVRLLGGADAAVNHAAALVAGGATDDLRFAATLLNHVVFAEPSAGAARKLLAEVYTRLGHSAENATWRNIYLTGAREVVDGPRAAPRGGGRGLLAALSVSQLLESLAIRVDGPRSWDLDLRVDWHLLDHDDTSAGGWWHARLHHGVLVHWRGDAPDPAAALTLTLTRPQLAGLLGTRRLDGIDHTGDLGVLQRLLEVLEAPEHEFAIVTP